MSQVNESKVLKDYANDLYLASDAVGMTEWEKDFAFDMSNQVNYSAKQKDKILSLVEKYEL